MAVLDSKSRKGSSFPRREGLQVWAWKFVRRYRVVRSELEFVNQLLPKDIWLKQRDLDRYLNELVDSRFLSEALADFGLLSHDGTTSLPKKLASTGRSVILALYVLPRVLRPETIIETGCFTGWYSALLLAAINLNGTGHMYSIDLPAEAGKFGLSWGLRPGVSPGFLVHERLRERWTLILGDTRRELGGLLERLHEIDLFFHDSDHSYSHMMWEYAAAWPYIRRGGVLVSDDISFNTAFWDFARGTRHPFHILSGNPSVGTMVKHSR